MTPRRNGKKRRIKIGIRPQLIILVCFSSLFSLLILAIVAGVYFSLNLSNLRADRLEVISQLKASQIQQSFQYIFYQVFWLSSRDTITTPLSNYRAGNLSQEVFVNAQTALDSFLTSEMVALARLYDLDLTVVAESSNNGTTLSLPLKAVLFPLAKNLTVPAAVTNNVSGAASGGYITGPLANSTDPESPFFFGITLPVYSNTSIILENPAVAGYLTVVANAQMIQSALDYSSSSVDSTDYVGVAMKGVYANNSVAGNPAYLIGFQTVFPVQSGTVVAGTFYPIDKSPAVKRSFMQESGISKNTLSFTGKNLAIGFTRIQIDSVTFWAVIIQQSRSRFLSPVRQLSRIMIGVVIGIGVFMCLLTFPLAVWFVNPITKLKEATEAITRSKKAKDQDALTRLSSATPGSPFAGGAGSGDQTPPANRNSVNSASSGSSTVYSTGIRLPGRIPQSKKLFKDELTELSDAFNIMTEELEKQYTHLEDRVKVRTKELEASKIEAEAANEAKTVFIANISHELRTPLNGILGMTSIAMDETDQLQIQDSLKLIHRSGELLLHILTELLTYSKNTLNRSKLEKSNFQILEVVYQVRSIFGKLALDQRVNFKITLKPNVLRKLILFGDSNRIIQVVMNLVSNSLKFTPVDGSVDVSFKLLGEYDHVKSKENGYDKVYVVKDVQSREEEEGADEDAPQDTNTVQEGPRSDFNGFFTGLAGKRKESNASLSVKKIEKEAETSSATVSLGEKSTDISDNQSIVTISTAEYENTVFKSQFISTKPLPQLPANRSASSSETSAVNSTISMHDDSANGEMVPMLNLKPAEKIEPLRPPIALRGGSNGTSGSNGQRTKSSRQTSYPAMNQISNSELVKNNKVFKMRKLYIPKAWVIQIEVTDTGPGIEPALQEKVFEPFIQGDQTLSRSYGGTGLGLSICRQLAKMMNGTLTLKSSIGKGSTFTFTLPLPQNGEIVVPDNEMEEFSNDEFNPNSRANRKVAFNLSETPESINGDTTIASVEPQFGAETTESNETYKVKDVVSKPMFTIEMPSNLLSTNHPIAHTSTGTANQTPSGDLVLDKLSDLKILVAEDNSVNQEVIKRMLRLEGFRNITMACNGAEAVDLVKQSLDDENLVDIIFMDVQMPKVDGLTATKLLRNNLRYNRPIIALTAFADESNVKECLNSGMSGFLSKPIKRTNLRQIITEFSPDLLSEVVTTPVTYTDEDDMRLGYGAQSTPVKR